MKYGKLIIITFAAIYSLALATVFGYSLLDSVQHKVVKKPANKIEEKIVRMSEEGKLDKKQLLEALREFEHWEYWYAARGKPEWGSTEEIVESKREIVVEMAKKIDAYGSTRTSFAQQIQKIDANNREAYKDIQKLQKMVNMAGAGDISTDERGYELP